MPKEERFCPVWWCKTLISALIGIKLIGDRSRGSWISDLKTNMVVRTSFKTARTTQENLGSKIKTSKQERSEVSKIKILSLYYCLELSIIVD